MMSDNKNTGDVSNAQIMHSIGQLTGTVQAMHQGMTARLEDMRHDIRRIEQTSKEQMNRVEDNLARRIAEQGEEMNKRMDGLETSVGEKITGLGTRVTALENEDKKIIEKVAKLSAVGGGVGGALAAAVVEIVKHI
jgi:DNA anti-recombination protein RmuC